LMLDYKFINDNLKWILDYTYRLGFIINNPYCWLPVCVLWWSKYNNNCIEVIEWKTLIEKWIKRRDTNKVYLEKCKKCTYKWLCSGVWKEYKKLYWNKWINSIK
jgi:hypothetical protein